MWVERVCGRCVEIGGGKDNGSEITGNENIATFL